MAIKVRRSEPRVGGLSKKQIVAAAIAILDAQGEDALTFRALAAELATGAGAIYWHIADKGELLAAAADEVIVAALAAAGVVAAPKDAIRAIALAVFDTVDARPWVGAQLNHEPWNPGTLRIFEGLGSGIVGLGVPDAAQFHAWSALVNYILGVAGQNAANARRSRRPQRLTFLDEVAARWEQLDPAKHPFMRRLASRLRGHDDREQFLAGIDLILAGIEAADSECKRR